MTTVREQVTMALSELRAVRDQMTGLRNEATLGMALLEVLSDPNLATLMPTQVELLLQKAQKLMAANPDLDFETRMAALKKAEAPATQNVKAAIRRTNKPITAHGIKALSRSGGQSYTFDPDRMLSLGLSDFGISGQPLLRKTLSVDSSVYKHAVNQGMLDEEELIEAGAVSVRNNTRKAYIYDVDE